MNNNKFRQCVSTDGDDGDARNGQLQPISPSAVREMREHFSISYVGLCVRWTWTLDTVGIPTRITVFVYECALWVQFKPDKYVINRQYGNFLHWMPSAVNRIVYIFSVVSFRWLVRQLSELILANKLLQSR